MTDDVKLLRQKAAARMRDALLADAKGLAWLSAWCRGLARRYGARADALEAAQHARRFDALEDQMDVL